MLVAYGPDGRPVVAEETPLAQLQHWSREHALYCPNCRGNVHVRGGPDKQMQLHFAHQRGECAWSTESESVRHAQGKVVLSQWLQEQFPQADVRLEERLPEPNRIADIFVAHKDGRRWAVEFQCAPLDISEWTHRHTAYRKAGIVDIWIIGVNRREKQEAFIEAVIASAREVLFLDPQSVPPRIWLRWPITRALAQEWERDSAQHPTIEGWVGRHGYGATLSGSLQNISLDTRGNLIHTLRTSLEQQAQLRNALQTSQAFDEKLLVAYLHQRIERDTIERVVVPLIRAYVRDPELLRRYNYGRGQLHQPLSEDDLSRVQKAKAWLQSLLKQGISSTYLQELSKEIPFVGPYASFAKYVDMLGNLQLIDAAKE